MNDRIDLGGGSAEAMLCESGERYRQLIGVAPVAIFVHSEGRIVLANPAMVALFRARDAGQLLGRDVLDLIAPGSRELVRARIEQLYGTLQSVPLVEVECVRLDGSRFHAEVTAASFLYAGRPAAQVVARDITDRKAAERALRESEQRFRALTELSSDWYWEQDRELRFVRTKCLVEPRAGIRESDYLGKFRWEIPGNEVLGQSWDEHRRTLAARSPFRNLMLKRTDADGTVYFISVSGEPRFDDDGTFAGYRGVAKDVTESYQAQAALRESEQRFRALTSLSADWYWEQDAEYRFVEFSLDVKSSAGSCVKLDLGKTRWELPWSGVTEEQWARHRADLEARRPFRGFEYQRPDQRGELVWVSATGMPIFDSEGRFRGYRGIGTNITERKRAEAALRETSAKYETLVHSIEGIVWEADAATFAFTFVGGQAERLLGYPIRQWFDEPDFWRMHTHPDDVGWVAEFCLRATAELRNHEFEYRMIAADGSTVWLRDLVTVIVENGVAVRLRGIMIDITERKNAERALRESEHQVRALMRSVTSAQESERRRIAADLHDLVGQNLSALGLGLETLGAGLPEAERSRNRPRFDDLARLLRETMDAVRQTMSSLRPPLLDDYGLRAALESHCRKVQKRSGVRVTVEGSALAVRPTANVELALFRIAQEALAKAVKHARASQGCVVLSERDGRIRLSVEDDGIGLAQSASPGGWGMALMRERAEEMGGTLHLEFPGRGTRVIVQVPHVDPHPAG